MRTLHDRSILFEIIEKRTGQVVESFAFSLPPFSIQTSIAQRENITDTFDGVFIDDWGLGNQTMIITGTTGGSRIKTYKSGGKEISGSGEKELFDFRNKIIKYKINDSVKNSVDNFEIRFFDLTLSDRVNASYDAYVVRLVNFDIQRSKEKPKDFDYSIELFCVRSLLEKSSLNQILEEKGLIYKINSLEEDIGEEKEPLKKALTRIEAAREKIQSITKEADSAMGKLNDTRDVLSASLGVVGDCVASVNRYIEIAQNGLNIFYETTDGATGELTNIMDFAKKIVGFPLKIAKDTVKTVTNMIEQLVQKSKKLREETNSYLQFSMMTKKIAIQADEIVKGINDLVLYSKSFYDVKNINVYIGNSKVEYSSFSFLSLKENQTLENLAFVYLGDPSLGGVIAVFNGLSSSLELKTGQTIKIPSKGGNFNKDNPIFDFEHSDFIGRDLLLGEDGDLIFDSFGNIEVANQGETIKQAINLRLKESLGTRKRLKTYGTLKQVGTPSKIDNYFVSSIVETILQDVRVKSVNNIKCSSNGDKLMYEVEILLIDGAASLIRGQI